MKCAKIFIFSIIIFLNTNFIIKASSKNNYKKLRQKISAICKEQQSIHLGCEIYSLKNKRIVFSHNPHQLFIPASNTKLFTAALAYPVLGENYQFKTELRADGFIKNHTLQGNIYLKASGDPTFTKENLEALLKKISDKAIYKISGNFYIDCTLFDNQCFAPGSLLDNLGYSWNSGVCACMVDKKAFGLNAINQVSFMDNAPLQEIFFDGEKYIQTMFEKYGITLRGSIEFNKTSDQTFFLGAHYSAPLVELLGTMLKESDNLYADCIFKTLAARMLGNPGTWEKGAQALQQFLQDYAIAYSNQELVLKDGSGLSRYNLVSPHQIISLLCWIYQQPFRDIFINNLSTCALDGTLKKRLLDIPARVKAKTGTLAGVSSLSGYVESKHDLFAFSILVNGFISDSIYNPPCKTNIEDAICTILANY